MYRCIDQLSWANYLRVFVEVFSNQLLDLSLLQNNSIWTAIFAGFVFRAFSKNPVRFHNRRLIDWEQSTGRKCCRRASSFFLCCAYLSSVVIVAKEINRLSCQNCVRCIGCVADVIRQLTSLCSDLWGTLIELYFTTRAHSNFLPLFQFNGFIVRGSSELLWFKLTYFDSHWRSAPVISCIKM